MARHVFSGARWFRVWAQWGTFEFGDLFENIHSKSWCCLQRHTYDPEVTAGGVSRTTHHPYYLEGGSCSDNDVFTPSDSSRDKPEMRLDIWVRANEYVMVWGSERDPYKLTPDLH